MIYNGPKIAAVLGLGMNVLMYARLGMWAFALLWLLAAVLVTKYVPSR